LIDGPADALLLDDLGEVAADRRRSEPFCSARITRGKVMDRIGAEARRNRFGVGIVAGLDIGADDLFHARRLGHSTNPVFAHACPRVSLPSFITFDLPYGESRTKTRLSRRGVAVF
jgi:hypothetical protein